jgi:choice-of-anchor C domain-containing protein
MKKLILSIAAASSLTLALVGPGMAASLATNGSFEAGTNPGVSVQLSSGDSTTITGWTVSAGTIDYMGTYWQAADGVRSIDLSGSGPGAVRQTFATTVGGTYKVTFSMAGNPAGGPGMKTMTAGVGGTPAAFTYEIPGVNPPTLADMRWVTKSFTFTATAATTTLTFTSTTSSAFGPALDNVKVELNAASAKAFAVCKNGGWKTLLDSKGHHFKNQGDCVSYFATKFRNGGAIAP